MGFRYLVITAAILLIMGGCGKRDGSETEPSGESGHSGAADDLTGKISSVLPRTEELTGYEKVSDDLMIDPDELPDYLGTEAETFANYGVKKAGAADYMSADGELRFVIDVYFFDNVSNAFGIYAHGRSPNEHFVEVGTEGYIAAGSLFFFKGGFYVRVTGYIESPESDSGAAFLGRVTANRIPGEPVFPAAIRILPDESKLKKTERYYPSMFLDYDFFSPAYTAEYSFDDSVVTLVFIPRGSEAELIQYNQALIARGNKVFEDTDGAMQYYFCDDDIHGRVVTTARGGRLAAVVGVPRDAGPAMTLLIKLWENVEAAE